MKRLSIGSLALGLLLSACSPKQAAPAAQPDEIASGIINAALVDRPNSTLAPSVVKIVILSEAVGDDGPKASMASMATCTGSLIGEQVILTAGHCVSSVLGKKLVTLDFDAKTGAPNLKPGAMLLPMMLVGGFKGSVDAVSVTQGFVMDEQHPAQDIALIHLNKPFKLDAKNKLRLKIDTVGLATPGRHVLSMGYGVNEISQGFLGLIGGGEKSTDGLLRQKTFVVADRDSVPGLSDAVAAEDFITVTESGQSSGLTCQGDSGGPALVKSGGGYVVVGITSLGDSDCSHFSALVPVKNYVSWIKAQSAKWNAKLF